MHGTKSNGNGDFKADRFDFDAYGALLDHSGIALFVFSPDVPQPECNRRAAKLCAHGSFSRPQDNQAVDYTDVRTWETAADETQPLQLCFSDENARRRLMLCHVVRFAGQLIVALRESDEGDLDPLLAVDPLTCACPHLHFATRLENEIQRHRRYGTTFSVAAIEIGDFERLALRTGVSGGIPLLARVGRLLVATLREIDIVTHHREGEFHVVLPNVGLGEAHAGLERLRAIVESQSFSDLDQHMTLCGGIVEYAGETAAALFERCRLQLAQARTTSLRGFSVDRELL